MKELMVKLYSLNANNHFNDTLKALRVSNTIAKQKNYKDGYYILNINFSTQRVNIKEFPKENEEQASALYYRLERTADERRNAVVLVSVPQMQQLQEAYPSYFLDTSEFFNAIDTMMRNCEKWGWAKQKT